MSRSLALKLLSLSFVVLLFESTLFGAPKARILQCQKGWDPTCLIEVQLPKGLIKNVINDGLKFVLLNDQKLRYVIHSYKVNSVRKRPKAFYYTARLITKGLWLDRNDRYSEYTGRRQNLKVNYIPIGKAFSARGVEPSM